jgi:hypothetical protein
MKCICKFINILVVFVMVISCSKGGSTPEPIVADTTKPTISVADPTSNKSVLLGSALHLQMDLSDNVELKSYKVTIAKSLKGVVTSDWAFTQTWPIAAGKKSFAVNHNEIVVPLTVTGNQTTTGNYDLTVVCSDIAGNEISSTLSIVLSK